MNRPVDAEATLRALRGWITHWDKDRACGLAPTEESLADAAEMVDGALASLAITALSDQPGIKRNGRIVGLTVRHVGGVAA